MSAFLYISVFSLSSRSLSSSFPSAFSLPIISFSTLHLSPLTPLQPVLQLQVSKSQPEGVGSVGWLIQLPVDISADLTSPLSPLCSPAPSRPPGHMSSHCLLSIRPNYSVGIPRHSHTPILTDLTQVWKWALLPWSVNNWVYILQLTTSVFVSSFSVSVFHVSPFFFQVKLKFQTN